jgi:hypothetical protein
VDTGTDMNIDTDTDPDMDTVTTMDKDMDIDKEMHTVLTKKWTRTSGMYIDIGVTNFRTPTDFA